MDMSLTTSSTLQPKSWRERAHVVVVVAITTCLWDGYTSLGVCWVQTDRAGWGAVEESIPNTAHWIQLLWCKEGHGVGSSLCFSCHLLPIRNLATGFLARKKTRPF